MVLLFSKEEEKYVKIRPNKDFAFYCSKDAPEKIRISIEKKLADNKKWLESFGSE